MTPNEFVGWSGYSEIGFRVLFATSNPARTYGLSARSGAAGDWIVNPFTSLMIRSRVRSKFLSRFPCKIAHGTCSVKAHNKAEVFGSRMISRN